MATKPVLDLLDKIKALTEHNAENPDSVAFAEWAQKEEGRYTKPLEDKARALREAWKDALDRSGPVADVQEAIEEAAEELKRAEGFAKELKSYKGTDARTREITAEIADFLEIEADTKVAEARPLMNEKIGELKSNLTKAKGNMTTLLRNGSVTLEAGEEALELTDEADVALKKLYSEASAELNKVTGTLKSLTGSLTVRGVGETISKNLRGLNILEEGVAKGPAFARAAVAAGGATAVYNGLTVSRTEDGSVVSPLERLVKVVGGGAAIAGAAALGRA